MQALCHELSPFGQLTLPDAVDVIRHNFDPARKAMLIAQPLEDPLRGVPLLRRNLFIFFQDTVDNADKEIELWAGRWMRPHVTRRYRLPQHQEVVGFEPSIWFST